MNESKSIEYEFEMTTPNAVISIYEGTYAIGANGQSYTAEGKIEFRWTPSVRVELTGTCDGQGLEIHNAFSNGKSVTVSIGGQVFGDATLLKLTSIMGPAKIMLMGVVNKWGIIGERSIPVSQIRFGIPNMRGVAGAPIYRQTETGVNRILGRIRLENHNYLVNIDKSFGHREYLETLGSEGGFQILYCGEIVSKKGGITLESTSDVFQQLDAFFSFLNGRRTGTVLRQGVHDEEVIWRDFSVVNTIDSYMPVMSFMPRNSIAGINDMWVAFCELCKDESDKDFILTAIHWYNEANSNSGRAEGALIMAQTALELIYNWLVVEKKEIIIGRDSENISAANKIRLLLNQIAIPKEVPSSFAKLKEYIVYSSELADGPDAIVSIRNSLIHSQEEKRKKLAKISARVKVEALHLSIWYIELALLYILGFKGDYSNRCYLFSGVNAEEEPVPWVK